MSRDSRERSPGGVEQRFSNSNECVRAELPCSNFNLLVAVFLNEPFQNKSARFKRSSCQRILCRPPVSSRRLPSSRKWCFVPGRFRWDYCIKHILTFMASTVDRNLPAMVWQQPPSSGGIPSGRLPFADTGECSGLALWRRRRPKG